MSELEKIPFFKMHGLGNDFVVFDCRDVDVDLTADRIARIADRHCGVGFDQLAVLNSGPDAGQLVFYNSDGSMSGACGNATRCVARYILDQTGAREITLHTERGALACVDLGNKITSVNMGHPQLEWGDIPLAHEVDVDHLPIEGDPVATGMGNPHCTFFVEDAEAVDLAARGAMIEHHALYPERTNVQFAHVVGPDHVRMRVWERGVGVTLASGSSSCATAVAAARRGLTGRAVRIDLDGGILHIDWRADGVWMSGPTAHVFTGYFTADFWNGL